MRSLEVMLADAVFEWRCPVCGNVATTDFGLMDPKCHGFIDDRECPYYVTDALTPEQWAVVNRVAAMRRAIDEGYDQLIEIHGECGCTELAMHCGVSQAIGEFALTSREGNSAYVFFADGRYTWGSFTRFDDGTFSVS